MADRLGLVVAPGAALPAATKPSSAEPDPLKGGDVYGWAIKQAELIRARRFDEIDWINVADEIESVGKSEIRALRSNLTVVMTHMLKWDHQPERRSRSWTSSIGAHSAHADEELSDNPSLKPKLGDIIASAYKAARHQASGESDIPLKTFPVDCPYDWVAIMDRDFVLDQTDEAS